MPVWVLSVRIDLGYFRPNGGRIGSLQGFRNRPGIDEFLHAGWLYLDVEESLILEKHEALEYIEADKNLVLYLLDISDAEADAFVSQHYPIQRPRSYKVKKRKNKPDKLTVKEYVTNNFTKFNAEKITVIEAENILTRWQHTLE